MHEEPEGFGGAVMIDLGDEDLSTTAALAAGCDPLAGRVTWRGRVAAVLPLRTTVRLATAHGTAEARTTERDVWGTTRVVGVDRPPFPVELLGG